MLKPRPINFRGTCTIFQLHVTVQTAQSISIKFLGVTTFAKKLLMPNTLDNSVPIENVHYLIHFLLW